MFILIEISHIYTTYTVAALAIDKPGPRPCHFRPGPTSGPATRPGSQKSKISTEKNFRMFNHMICLLYMRVHNRTKTIMRRCVTCVKLCVFVMGSMMMGIGYRKTQIELLIFVLYTF